MIKKLLLFFVTALFGVTAFSQTATVTVKINDPAGIKPIAIGWGGQTVTISQEESTFTCNPTDDYMLKITAASGYTLDSVVYNGGEADTSCYIDDNSAEVYLNSTQLTPTITISVTKTSGSTTEENIATVNVSGDLSKIKEAYLSDNSGSTIISSVTLNDGTQTISFGSGVKYLTIKLTGVIYNGGSLYSVASTAGDVTDDGYETYFIPLDNGCTVDIECTASETQSVNVTFNYSSGAQGAIESVAINASTVSDFNGTSLTLNAGDYLTVVFSEDYELQSVVVKGGDTDDTYTYITQLTLEITEDTDITINAVEKKPYNITVDIDNVDNLSLYYGSNPSVADNKITGLTNGTNTVSVPYDISSISWIGNYTTDAAGNNIYTSYAASVSVNGDVVETNSDTGKADIASGDNIVIVTATKDAKTSYTYTFTTGVDEDILEFGYSTGMENGVYQFTPMTDNVTFEDGVYTVSGIEVSDTQMTLVGSIKSAYADSYKVTNLTDGESTLSFSSSQFSVSISRYLDDSDFTVTIVESDTDTRTVTLAFSSPSDISRVYNENVNLTPAASVEYALSNGTSLTIEPKSNYQITSVTVEGKDIVSGLPSSSEVTLDLSDIENGATITIVSESTVATFTYTVTTGLDEDVLEFGYSTGYSQGAYTFTPMTDNVTFADGVYTITNLYVDYAASQYALIGSIKSEYTDDYTIKSATGTSGALSAGTTQFSISMGQYEGNSSFTVVIDKKETTERVVTIEVSDIAGVQRAFFTSDSGKAFTWDNNKTTVTVPESNAYVVILLNNGYSVYSVTPSDVVDSNTPFPVSGSIQLNLTNVADGTNIFVNFSDTSAIESINADGMNADKTVYDLFGRQVKGNLAPGIYVVDGVKTVIR